MTEITVNGTAYSDEGESARDMRNGGHRTWLLPMLSDVMVSLPQASETTLIVAPGNAGPLDRAAASFFGDGVNDEVSILAAVNGTSALALQEMSLSPPSYSNSVIGHVSVRLLPGVYTLGSTLILPDLGEVRLEWDKGVVFNYTPATGDAVQVQGCLRSRLEFPVIYTNSSGAALHLMPPSNIGILDSVITCAGLVGTNQTGDGLRISAGVATNPLIRVQGIWGFNRGVAAINTSGMATIDTNWIELGFLRANNINIYIHANASGLIAANSWKANLDQTIASAIGLETDAARDSYDLVVGNAIGATGTIVQLDATAQQNRLRILPPIYTSGFLGAPIIDNSGNFSNTFNGGSSEQIIGGSSAGTNLAASTTYYFGSGAQDNLVLADAVGLTIPYDCQIQRLWIKFPADIGVGHIATATLRKSGSDTALTCTVTGNGSTGIQAADLNLTHTITFAAGDTLSVKVVTSAGFPAFWVSWGAVLVRS